jgi:hypothetical protein
VYDSRVNVSETGTSPFPLSSITYVHRCIGYHHPTNRYFMSTSVTLMYLSVYDSSVSFTPSPLPSNLSTSPAQPSVWEGSISSNFNFSSFITPTPSTSSPPSLCFIRYMNSLSVRHVVMWKCSCTDTWRSPTKRFCESSCFLCVEFHMSNRTRVSFSLYNRWRKTFPLRIEEFDFHCRLFLSFYTPTRHVLVHTLCTSTSSTEGKVENRNRIPKSEWTYDTRVNVTTRIVSTCVCRTTTESWKHHNMCQYGNGGMSWWWHDMVTQVKVLG